jgi:hypothetical protein
MSFPPPDAEELNSHLPTQKESIINAIDWGLDIQQCDCLFMSLDAVDKPLFVNDCIARLWGYSNRIWSSSRLSLRQMAQIPRFAMCSFYAQFFDFAYGILNAANLLKNNEMPVRPASVVMDNPIQGLPLAQRMKDVLLYAPREYFACGLKHHAYLLIVKNVYERVMSALQTSIPISVRLHASTHFKTAQKSFNEFLFTLQNPTTDSIRIFIAKCDRIIHDFKSALEELAAILKCVEDDIQLDSLQTQPVQLNTEISEKLDTLIGASKNAAKSDKEIKEPFANKLVIMAKTPPQIVTVFCYQTLGCVNIDSDRTSHLPNVQVQCRKHALPHAAHKPHSEQHRRLPFPHGSE